MFSENVKEASKQAQRLPEIELDETVVGRKPTPAAGFRIPKTKQNEEVIGHRVYGDTNIFTKPQNYNYEMRRSKEEKRRFNFLKVMIGLSALPIGAFLYNAEENFKKSQVK